MTWRRKVSREVNPDRASRVVSPDSTDRANRPASPIRRRLTRVRNRPMMKRTRTATVSVVLRSFSSRGDHH